MKIIKGGWLLVRIIVLVTIIAALATWFTAEDFSRPINFKSVVLHSKPNQFLVCPPRYCLSKPHRHSKTYPVSAPELAATFEKIARSQPRTTLIADQSSRLQKTWQQTTPLMHFPDRITVQFIPLTPKTSTLAIYSRSKYGYSDMSANKTRITRWLSKLDAALANK